MKYQLLVIFSLACNLSFAQLELTTGYAAAKHYVDGIPVHIGYDVKIRGRLFTKSQIGYKSLYHFDDFTELKIRARGFEVHQTVSYEIVRRPKFILKPNVGVHYKWYKWEGLMVPPLNTLPGRAYVGTIENQNDFTLVSDTERYYKLIRTNRPGFSFHLQTQYRLGSALWLHITPFIEPDYQRVQNTGGCYVGIIFKNKKS